MKGHHWMRSPKKKNIVQTARGQAAGSSATAKGRSAVRGRDKGKGKAASSIRSCFLLGF